MDEKKEYVNSLMVKIFGTILKAEEIWIAENSGKKLTVGEIHTLEAIGTAIVSSMTSIAQSLAITVGTLTITTSRLVLKGYVERYRNENDRRSVYLRLTEAGEKIVESHKAFHGRMMDLAFLGLSESDAGILTRMLENINTAFGIAYLNNQKI
ncbi:MAG: hypothetical protein BGN88_02295 [Clostridiales bacterium 43-6]|nr:MAG: hypothetical protein BGN88_02295 [Clostridiales bacterium 43-6]